MPHISHAELASHGELRDHFDLMCLEVRTLLTEDTATSRATSSQVGVKSPHNIMLWGLVTRAYVWHETVAKW